MIYDLWFRFMILVTELVKWNYGYIKGTYRGFYLY